MARPKWLLWVILAGLCLSACRDTSPTVVVSSTLEATATVKLLTTTPSLPITTSSPVQTQPVSTTVFTQAATTAFPTTAFTTSIVATTAAYKPPVIGTVYLASTKDGGETWTPVITQTGTLNEQYSGFDNLECIASKTCLSLKDSLSTKFELVREGPNTWQMFLRPENSDISCISTLECWVLEFNYGSNGVSATKDGGKTWTNLTKGKNFNLTQANKDIYLKARRNAGIESEIAFTRSISCVNSSRCLLIGGGGRVIRTIDSGKTWEWFFTEPKGYFEALCLTEFVCYAISVDGVSVSSDFGETWNKLNITSTGKRIKEMSCPSITNCVAVGDAGLILSTQNAGITWLEYPALSSNHIDDISCPTDTTCYSVDSNKNLLITHDAGKSWSIKPIILDKFNGVYARISCPTSLSCYTTFRIIN